MFFSVPSSGNSASANTALVATFSAESQPSWGGSGGADAISLADCLRHPQSCTDWQKPTHVERAFYDRFTRAKAEAARLWPSLFYGAWPSQHQHEGGAHHRGGGGGDRNLCHNNAINVEDVIMHKSQVDAIAAALRVDICGALGRSQLPPPLLLARSEEGEGEERKERAAGGAEGGAAVFPGVGRRGMVTEYAYHTPSFRFATMFLAPSAWVATWDLLIAEALTARGASVNSSCCDSFDADCAGIAAKLELEAAATNQTNNQTCTCACAACDLIGNGASNAPPTCCDCVQRGGSRHLSGTGTAVAKAAAFFDCPLPTVLHHSRCSRGGGRISSCGSENEEGGEINTIHGWLRGDGGDTEADDAVGYAYGSGGGVAADGGQQDGDTPLHIACHLIRPSAARLLLALGADPLAPNALGFTPVDVLRETRRSTLPNEDVRAAFDELSALVLSEVGALPAPY